MGTLNAAGKTIIVPPYVDEQTGEVIISLARLLNDKESVISFDFVLNNVQEITKNINLDNKGYGFIITDEGLVIAHYDESKKGVYFFDEPEMSGLARKIVSTKNVSFVYEVDGSKNDALLELYGKVLAEAKKYLDKHTAKTEDTGAAEVSEISPEKLSEYIEKIRSACLEYDGDTVSALCSEAGAYSCRGITLRPLLDDV